MSALTAQFAEDGYSRPYQVLTPDECTVLRDLLVDRVLPTPGPNFRNERGLRDDASCRHRDTPAIARLVTDRRLLEPVLEVLGSPVQLFLSRIWTKPPEHEPPLGYSTADVPWHQDNTHFPIEPKVSLNAWLAVTAAVPANGGLEVVPGSHRELHPVHLPAGETFARTIAAGLEGTTPVRIDLRPGQCFLFDGRLLHSSGPNRSDAIRIGIQFNFTPIGVRVRADYPYPGHRLQELGEQDLTNRDLQPEWVN